jgi:hypothetical protein
MILEKMSWTYAEEEWQELRTLSILSSPRWTFRDVIDVTPFGQKEDTALSEEQRVRTRAIRRLHRAIRNCYSTLNDFLREMCAGLQRDRIAQPVLRAITAILEDHELHEVGTVALAETNPPRAPTIRHFPLCKAPNHLTKKMIMPLLRRTLHVDYTSEHQSLELPAGTDVGNSHNNTQEASSATSSSQYTPTSYDVVWEDLDAIAP